MFIAIFIVVACFSRFDQDLSIKAHAFLRSIIALNQKKIIALNQKKKSAKGFLRSIIALNPKP